MRFNKLSQRGLTLIEMMVVIAIVGILAAMAVQIGVHWINTSKVSYGQSTLQHAYSTAKSVALQNHHAKKSNEISASMCIDHYADAPDRVKVVLGSDCAATAVWTGLLDKGVSVGVGANTSKVTGVTCVGLGSAGVPLPLANSDCVTALSYFVAAGNVRVENKQLY